jgi:hypothetical protein
VNIEALQSLFEDICGRLYELDPRMADLQTATSTKIDKSGLTNIVLCNSEPKQRL